MNSLTEVWNKIVRPTRNGITRKPNKTMLVFRCNLNLINSIQKKILFDCRYIKAESRNSEIDEKQEDGSGLFDLETVNWNVIH